MMRERHFLLAVLLVVLLSFLLKYAAVGPLSPLGYTDVRDFYIPDGGVPYAAVSFEYPVVIALFVYTMSVLGGSLTGYFLLSSLGLAAAALLCAHLLFLTAKGRRIESRAIPFFACSLSLLFFTIYNWDMLALLFTAMALYFADKRKDALASASLALGFCTKLFPALFLLPLLMRRKWMGGIKIICTFVAVFLALNIYFIAASFNGWSYQFTTHSSRGPNIDSVWGIIGLGFPGFSAQISIISFAMLGAAYILLNFRLRRSDYVQACLASLLVFLLFNKVFSPQYAIWLLPFFVLFAPLRRRDFYLLEASNIAVLLTILYWYNSPGGISALLLVSLAFVVIRHLALFNMLRRTGRLALLAAAAILAASLAAFAAYAIMSGPVAKPGIVSLAFDDGLETTYANAYPLMRGYGFNGTAYLIAGNNGTFEGRPEMSDGQVLEMQSGGWEIGSHGMTHANLLENRSSAAYEILGSKQALENRGFAVKSFAVPYGKYDDSVARIVRSQYSSARTSVWGLNNPLSDDLYYLKSVWVENTTKPGDVCSRVYEARDNGLWLVLMFHYVGSSERQYDVTAENFSSVLECINASGITVKTISEAQAIYER